VDHEPAVVSFDPTIRPLSCDEAEARGEIPPGMIHQATAKQDRASMPAPSSPSGNGPAAGWERPIGLGPVRDRRSFPVDALPDWAKAIVIALAEATQTPVDLPAVLVLAVLATAAGGRVRVRVRDGWEVPTNLFVTAAMEPGERKTAVFDRLAAPVMAAQEQAAAVAAADICNAEVRRSIARAKADKAQQEADADPDNKDKLTAATEARAAAEEATVPARPRYLADDTTPEALTSLLAEHRGRMAVLSDEGGELFAIMAGRYSRNGSPNLGVILKGHAGSPLLVDRKGRPHECIKSPALTLGLAVQPEVLRQLADLPGARGRGLLGRFLWSIPESMMGRRRIGCPAVPVAVAERYDTEVKALVKSLADLGDPVVVEFSAEADARLKAFEADLEPHLGDGGDLAHVRDWAAKLAGHVARIAGLLHVATHLHDGWPRPIAEATVAAAIGMANYFTGHALAVFDLIGADPTLTCARRLLRWIERHDGVSFTRREIHQAHRSLFPKAADIDPALDLLTDHGYIRKLRTKRPDSQGGRPPSPVYGIHPDVRDPVSTAHNSQNTHNPDEL
jgi:replicative DNA helicase